MSEIDAAELARLRGLSAAYVGCPNAFSNGTVLALLEALEKARGELRATNYGEAIHQARTAMALARDERDSARALLRESAPHIERAMVAYRDGWIEEKQDILARIAAELDPKP